MNDKPNKAEGPLTPGGGRGGERSEEARQALLQQLKADFANIPLQPETLPLNAKAIAAMGEEDKTLGKDAGTDTPEVIYPDLDSSGEYPGGEEEMPWGYPSGGEIAKGIAEGFTGEGYIGQASELYAAMSITAILQEASELFARKNAEYGNAIDHTGTLGSVVAMTGDIARLRKLVLRSPQHGRETSDNVRDKFLDILVQAAIGIYMVDEENWEGV